MADRTDCRFCQTRNAGKHKCKALPRWYGEIEDDGTLDYNFWLSTRPNEDTERSERRDSLRRSRALAEQRQISRLHEFANPRRWMRSRRPF